MRRLIVCLFLILLLNTALRVSAHANLARSEPAANAVLAEAPTEIRLWFTEPLEPNFSRIRLQDASGAHVDTAASQIDATDSTQMFLSLDDLPDGLYTVVWQVVSAADGHPTNGNFAFAVGEGTAGAAALAQSGEMIPVDSALIRGFHLFSIALIVGSIGFLLFVWQPTVNLPDADKRLYRLMWIGWGLLGAANALMFLLYVSTLTGTPLLNAIFDPMAEHALETRYGQLWLIRTVLWLLLELALFAGRKDRRFLWMGLIIGALIAVAQGFSSHASAAPDRLAAMLNDALHVFATALWLGGLVQFINALLWLKSNRDLSTQFTGTLVRYFSNYARVAVILLIISGCYSGWLQVGSVQALLNTTYGQVLLLKLVLFAPLLLIAAINLIFTPRGLQRADSTWADYLRGLVGAEIALIAGILIAAGVLTSINTGRAAEAQQRTLVIEPEPQVAMQITDQYHVHLEITPGWVGQNTFNLGLYDLTTEAAVNDASLVRLRFTNLSQNMGNSELRPTFVSDGLYTATGANLSTPGRWRLRMTLQRPGMFDTVLDFVVTVEAAPPPPPFDMTIPPPERMLALAFAGLGCLLVGGFIAAEKRLRLFNGAGLLAVFALLVGIVMVISSIQLIN